MIVKRFLINLFLLIEIVIPLVEFVREASKARGIKFFPFIILSKALPFVLAYGPSSWL